MKLDNIKVLKALALSFVITWVFIGVFNRVQADISTGLVGHWTFDGNT
jgi:hypothetical protein